MADELPSIASDSKEFDEIVGMHRADFRSFYKTYVLGCKEWKVKPPVSTEIQP